MKRTPRISPCIGLILALCFVLQAAGCITPFFDPDRYEGARIKLATKYNTLMAEKMAPNMDSIPKMPASTVDMPDTNMWCPQVRKPRKAIPRDE